MHLCPIERSLPTTFSSCKLKVHSCTTTVDVVLPHFSCRSSSLSPSSSTSLLFNFLSLSGRSTSSVPNGFYFLSVSRKFPSTSVSFLMIGLSLSSLLSLCLFGRLVAYLAGQRIAFTDFINSPSPPTSPSDTIHRDIIRRCSFPSSHLHCPFHQSRRRLCYFRFSILYLAADCLA